MVVCQPQLGSCLRKASFCMAGTAIGAMAIVVLTACFQQDRIGFLLGLALWGATCGFVAIRENLPIYKSVRGVGSSIRIGRKVGSRGHSDVDCYGRAVLQRHDAFDPGGDISERRADRETQGNLPPLKVDSQVRFLHIRLLKDLHFGPQNFVDDRIAGGERR
jgi:hypothetical protein